MKTSTDRILTTHTGSLPRPKPLIDLILRREKGEAIAADAFEAETVKAVDDIVAQQVAAGIDVVTDGEMSKPSYTTYIRHRVERHRDGPARRRKRPRHHDRPRYAGSFRTSPASAAISPPCRFPAASATCATRTAPRSTAIWHT